MRRKSYFPDLLQALKDSLRHLEDVRTLEEVRTLAPDDPALGELKQALRDKIAELEATPVIEHEMAAD